MTGLLNTAGDGDLVPVPRLCDPEAVPDTEVVSVPPLELEPWRDEVAARLARYRARRKPRAPRYPSLLLPFESSDISSRRAAGAPQSPAAAPRSEDVFLLRESGVPADSALTPTSQDHDAPCQRPAGLPPMPDFAP